VHTLNSNYRRYLRASLEDLIHRWNEVQHRLSEWHTYAGHACVLLQFNRIRSTTTYAAYWPALIHQSKSCAQKNFTIGIVVLICERLDWLSDTHSSGSLIVRVHLRRPDHWSASMIHMLLFICDLLIIVSSDMYYSFKVTIDRPMKYCSFYPVQ
jgi:hypothetical protein